MPQVETTLYKNSVIRIAWANTGNIF